MARMTMADLESRPPKLTSEARARIDAMTEEEIERNAEQDTEQPPLTDEQLDRAVFARMVRQAREADRLTQDAFAKRYHITLSRLKDWKQGRFKPDSVSAAYLKVIRHDPKAVQRALGTE